MKLDITMRDLEDAVEDTFGPIDAVLEIMRNGDFQSKSIVDSVSTIADVARNAGSDRLSKILELIQDRLGDVAVLVDPLENIVGIDFTPSELLLKILKADAVKPGTRFRVEEIPNAAAQNQRKAM